MDMSQWFPDNVGVIQCSVISPLLLNVYNIYIYIYGWCGVGGEC